MEAVGQKVRRIRRAMVNLFQINLKKNKGKKGSGYSSLDFENAYIKYNLTILIT